MTTVRIDTNQLPLHLRPFAWGKRQVKARAAERITIGTLCWSGGARDSYTVVNLETGESKAVTDNRPWPADQAPLGETVIPPNFAIVLVSQFGSHRSITFYLRPENLTPMLPTASAMLSSAEKLVLSATASFKSSYVGRDRFDMAQDEMSCRHDGLVMTRQSWETAKSSLIARGYINARGAITTAGRNALESVRGKKFGLVW